MTARHSALPWLALCLTVLIWASYLVVVRAAMTSRLSPIDMGLLRTLPAALFLLPYTLRAGLLPDGAKPRDGILIGLVGGGLFIFCLSLGLRYAPASDSGVFTPSMLPVFVGLLAFIFLGRRLTRMQLAGLACIIVGATLTGGASAPEADQPVRVGHLLFLCASLSWATFTVRFKASGLSPKAATSILATWPAIAFVLAALIFGTGLFDVSASVFALQLSQGIAAGLIANFTFMYAVHKLGPHIPAASAALVPILAAIGAALVLDEPITPSKATGIAVVVFGVILASGVLARRQRVAQN